MKIFNKKNLKKGLTYTAAVIGGGIVTFVALAMYGKKLEDKEILRSDFEDEEIFDTENEQIMEAQEEA